MGCFPCYGDSSMKEKDKKRINNRVRNDNQNNLGNTKNQTNNNRHVHTRDDLVQNSKEQKVSPLRDVKDEEAKDASQRRDVKDEDAKDESQSASSSDASPAENISGDGQPGTSFKARTFTYDELVEATGRFKEEDFLGEGGFGRVYKGFLKDTGETPETI
ncbi:hypothetical protein Leryth_000339 [Lithospermum erythrorhizon]|nr:hypothetical protein Leryth_000339 [Lithospermum erythrorhizon]